MNKRVYYYRGWRMNRIEGIVQGFTESIFGGTKVVVLITSSCNLSYVVGHFDSVPLDEIKLNPFPDANEEKFSQKLSAEKQMKAAFEALKNWNNSL